MLINGLGATQASLYFRLELMFANKLLVLWSPETLHCNTLYSALESDSFSIVLQIVKTQGWKYQVRNSNAEESASMLTFTLWTKWSLEL